MNLIENEKRNQHIVSLYRNFAKIKDLASQFNLSKTRVKQIIEQHISSQEIRNIKAAKVKNTALKYSNLYLAKRKI